ncbi:hypothetical protein ACFY7Y_32045 [Streptomyces virginiae]|uniref:hypothetical protein n=1 Tax=Streptomyces virginiae TaxID=1961 RepID=UPI00368E4A42
MSITAPAGRGGIANAPSPTDADGVAVVSVAVEVMVSIACALLGSRNVAAVGVAPLVALVGRTGSGGRWASIATLNNFNRVFVAQRNILGAPGGLGVVDGGTLLTRTPIGTPQAFVALAVNNRTAKVYAVDQANAKVAVFRTGSV